MNDEMKKMELLKQIERNIPKKEKFDDYEMEILDQLSRDINDCIRSRVARILVDFTDDVGESILIRLTRDVDSLVRAQACDSLSSSNSRETFNLLSKMAATDKNGMVRGYAISSMSVIAKNNNINNEAITFLQIILSTEKTVFAKINIYAALYLLGVEEYLQLLIDEINTRVYQNRCAVINNLREVINAKNISLIRQALYERRQIEKTFAVNSTIDTAICEIDEITATNKS